MSFPPPTESRPLRVLDTAIELLLVALLAFSPLALGAVEAWREGLALAAGALLALLVATRQTLFPQRDHGRWIYLPIAAYILFAAAQLIPLPAPLLNLLSPRALSLRQELLSDLPDAPALLRHAPLSLYPHATRHALCIVLLATVVFITVLTLFRTTRSLTRLLVWIALLGAIIGGIALAQDLTRAPGIYWRIRIGHTAYSGPFVNHSHFSQFMNLCIGAALALFIASLQKTGGGLRNVAWWTIPIIVLGGITIPLSFSRGGIIAMLAGGAALALLLILRGSVGRTAILLLLVGAVPLATLVYFGVDKILSHVRSAATPQAYGIRLEMDKAAVRAWRDFPLTGFGLGAHEYVFPQYETNPTVSVATQLESELLQSLEETGIFGALCVLAFITIILIALARAARSRDPSGALAVGLGYSFVAVFWHSFTDYGQHLPAIASLSAAVCGAILNVARTTRISPLPPSHHSADPHLPLSQYPERGQGEGSFGNHQRPHFSKVLLNRLLPLPLGLAVSATLLSFAWTSYQAETSYNRARESGDRLAARNWRGTDAAFADLLASSQAALNNQRNNIIYHYWLGAYRWRSVTRQRNAQGNVELSGSNLDQAHAIISELNAARSLCPTYGPIYWYIGEKELLLGDTDAAERHILTAARLAPGNPDALMLVAHVHLLHERWADAAQIFSRVLNLAPARLEEITDEYVYTFNELDRLMDLLGDNWRPLLQVSDRLYRDPTQQAAADRVRAKVLVILEELVKRPDAPHPVVGTLAILRFGQSNFSAAEQLFARVIALDPNNTDAHFLRARSLHLLGRDPEARSELQIVLKQNPNHPGAKDLLKTLDNPAR
ncbi:MAG TPA: O-antigen ligase family protein [Tepidisphaeraceae bacterium]